VHTRELTSRGFSRPITPRGVLLLVGIVVVLVTGRCAPAKASLLPTCLNYEQREEFGSVLVDTRVPPTFDYVTWLWNIDDPTERSGYYEYSILINGRVVESRPQMKDDNLHSGLPASTEQGVNWRHGDTFALRAMHLSEAQNAIYVAAANACVIP